MSDGQSGDRFRDRADENRWLLWVLLEADRWLVTAAFLGGLLVGLVVAGTALPGAVGALRSGDPVETLFQALVAGILTTVTLVLTINQLVLSQELGAVGDQRERMEGALSFREEVADAVGAPVGPARPSQFLRALVQVAGERAVTLREHVGADGGTLSEATGRLTDSLVGSADRVSTDLDAAQFGEYEVISAALDFDYSRELFAARRIRAEYGDDLDAEATAALDDIVEVLSLFGPAREHFKTLYFQWELVDLSRGILAAAIPALVVAIGTLAFVDVGDLSGTVGSVPVAVAVVAGTTTVALLPFALLLAYVVRIATVTKYTLAIGPFFLRETEAEEVEWD
jgi:hypothetical protein